VGQLAEGTRSLVPHIAGGHKLTRMVLNAAMEAATGSTSASGVWSQRDSFQMMEMVVIQSLREQSVPSTVVQALSFLNDLEARLPTQTVRSEEQIEHQHFSTPLGLAWLAAHLADLQPDDIVLEPSAGTGMLAIWGRHAASLHLNEIDPVRQEFLRYLFPTAQVTGFDAVRIGAHLTQRPSVVLMNPPFARNAAGIEDPTTAARHLAAALGVLKPDGRLVAIMPDSFQPQGRRAELFQRALRGASVAFHARLEGAFTKQGTSIPVRLLVIDKRAGAISTTVINRSNLADLLPFLCKVPARRRVASELPLVAAPPAQPSKSTAPLLGGFRTGAPKLAPANPRSNTNGAMPLPYAVRDTIADAEQAIGVYVAYRPQRLVFDDAGDHPTQLVESAAMASVALPAPSYIPQLPANVIRDRVLSRAQLETLVHALDATSSDLPGRYYVPGRGLELVPDAEGTNYRRGFFLGDGTGAGKGRQLASILMDQWLRGHRRHLWISESNALILSRLCESVLARAPPVQWGGYSRRMDITRPITMLTRLKPGQHCDLPFPEAHAATVLHGSRRPENARRCRWRCRSTYHGRDSGDGKLRPCRGHALHPRRGWQLRPRPQQVPSCRSDHGRSIAEQPARLCARYRRVAALPRGAARWKIFMGGGSRGHRSLP